MNKKSKTDPWFCIELPVTAYHEASAIQHRLLSARINQVIEKEMALLLEHFPVFTIGRRGGMENLTVSTDFLKKENISIVQIERGGDITFHGPGQIICYPIVHLRSMHLTVVDFVTALEEVMLQTVADWGIGAVRNQMNRGIWIKDCKLGSIGIAVRKGVSFHGFALNVNTALKPFDWINPCGLAGVKMTSMKQVLSKPLDLNRVYKSVKHHLQDVFGIELINKNLSDLPPS